MYSPLRCRFGLSRFSELHSKILLTADVCDLEHNDSFYNGLTRETFVIGAETAGPTADILFGFLS